MKRLFTQIMLSVFCIQLIMSSFISVNVFAAEPLVNLIENGDMEGLVNNWKSAGSVKGADISLVEDTSDPTNHVLRYDGTNITEGSISYVAYNNVLTSGEKYYFHYKIRMAKDDTNEGDLYAYNSNHTATTETDRPKLSKEWVTRSGEFTAQVTSYNFKITNTYTSSSGNANVKNAIYELDDVVICELPFGDVITISDDSNLNGASLHWETGVISIDDKVYARADSMASFTLTPPSDCEINTVTVNDAVVTPVNDIYNIEIPDDLTISVNVDVIEDDGVPELLSTIPENGSINADTNDMVLKVTFDRDMSIDSLKSDITVTPEASFEVENAGEFTYNLVFDKLTEGTEYTVIFTDNLKSELGVPMAEPVTYTFTTEFPYVNIIENGDMSDTSSLSMYDDNGNNTISYDEVDGNSVLKWKVTFNNAPLFQYLYKKDRENQIYNFIPGHKYYVKARVKADDAIKMSLQTIYRTDADKTNQNHDKIEVNIEADKWTIVHNYFTIPDDVAPQENQGIRIGADKTTVYVDDIELIDCSVAPGGNPDFVESYPENNASEVEIGKGELEMSITFDEPLLPTTVNTTNITAKDAVIKDINVSEDKKTCIISLSQLKVNKTVKISYKNLLSLGLEKVEEGSVSFNTETMSKDAPKIVKSSPYNGEKIKLSNLKDMEIVYDLPLDGEFDKESFTTVPENLIESVEWTFDKPEVISIKLNKECLSEGTTYSVTPNPSSIKSLASTPVNQETITFKTIDRDEIVQIFKDTSSNASQDDVQKILDFVTEYYGELNPDDTLCKNLLQKDSETAKKFAEAILAAEVDPDADAEDVIEVILSNAVLAVVNHSQKEELIDEAVESILTANDNTALLKTYNTLQDNVKKDLCGDIKAMTEDFEQINDFTNYLEKPIIFTALKNANGSKAISNILNNHIGIWSSKTQTLIGNIDNLNSETGIAKIYSSLEGKTVSSDDGIYNILNEAYGDWVSESNKKPSSGGSGGGGGKTTFTPVVQVERPTVNTQNSSVFKDIESVPWAKEAIEHFYELNVITGKTLDTFCPNDFVTREEFIKMIVLAADIPMTEANNKYSDVDKNAWYYPYILAATNVKLVQGIDDVNFGIGRNITRQDIATICNRLLTAIDVDNDLSENDENIIPDYDDISEYAKEAVDRLVSLEIIKGDENGRFAPNKFATRAETAVLLQRLVAFKNAEGR